MGDKLFLEDISVVVIDPDSISRQTIRNILVDNGFRHITMGSTMKEMLEALEDEDRDLLIIDQNLSDGNLSDFVHKLRHYETKFNPFIPIIATAWSPTQDDVRAIVQSGVDHIVGKPLSPSNLMQRIKVLALDRKPFVVTSQYIGPDRRKKDDKRDSDVIPLKVPNTLQAKATREKEEVVPDMQKEIDQCVKRINIQKLDRNASQVIFLTDRIIPALENSEIDETTTRSLDRLLYVSEDISRRMTGTPYDHVSGLCKTLIDVTKRIIDAGDEPDSKDVELLRPVSLSIQTGFAECDTKTQRMAAQISQSVERGQKKAKSL